MVCKEDRKRKEDPEDYTLTCMEKERLLCLTKWSFFIFYYSFVLGTLNRGHDLPRANVFRFKFALECNGFLINKFHVLVVI